MTTSYTNRYYVLLLQEEAELLVELDKSLHQVIIENGYNNGVLSPDAFERFRDDIIQMYNIVLPMKKN